MTSQVQERTNIFGISLDRLDQAGAIKRILSWCAQGLRGHVVTVNLDFLVKARTDPVFAKAINDADLSLADGMPLVWASHISGMSLPGRVTGADLIIPLCKEAAKTGRSVFLIGSTFEILAAAARKLVAHAPRLEIAGVYAPAFGFSALGPNTELEDFVTAVRPDILFVALGAPKQEIWARYARDHLPVHAVLGIGAGLDFIAGAHARAPQWLQRLGLEWLYRFLSEPRRLGMRYAACGILLPRLMLGEVAHACRRRLGLKMKKTCAL